MTHAAALAALAAVILLAAPRQAAAQPSDEQSPAAQALGGFSGPGNAGAPGGSSGFGRHGRNGNSSGGSAPGEMPPLKPIVEPRQRLDPGALLCHTEAQLKQHQAAIMARLEGRTAPEPAGCHIVGQITAVAVVEHDGQAVTEVQLAGDEPAVGWTDAVIRDADPLRSPLRN
jgi:hypothetical protein